MTKIHVQLLIFISLYFLSNTLTLSLPFSSFFSSSPPQKAIHGKVAKYTIPAASDSGGEKLLENAKRKMSGPNTCWHNSYRVLFASCSDIISNKDNQQRLAWMLSDCFQADSGRSAFPKCDLNGPVSKCTKKLDDSQYKTYLEFYLETNSLCHQLQSDTFKHEMERLVNDLAESAKFAENMLETIEEKSEKLLQNSNQIHDSLALIEHQTEQMGQTTKGIEVQIENISDKSEGIMKHSKDIAASQLELSRGQVAMREAVESGVARLQKSYRSLGEGMEELMGETVKIEKEVKTVSESMASKMKGLQDTADQIGTNAGLSLEKQNQLLDGQASARKGLDELTKFQSQALEESRGTIKQLSEFAHKQQEELLKRHKQIQQMHDSLYENSESILEAQKEFKSKQASIFAALDKLFALHNAILVESRFIKAFFFYSCVIFVLYMLTSTKETFGIRARLYLGLCAVFVLEFAIVRLGPEDFNTCIWMIRTGFLVLASGQILYSIFTYRDLDFSNHQILQKLVQKICFIEENMRLESDDDDNDLSLSDYSWIDQELPDDVDIDEDPNYFLEEVAENSIITSIAKKYDLRPRAHLRIRDLNIHDV